MATITAANTVLAVPIERWSATRLAAINPAWIGNSTYQAKNDQPWRWTAGDTAGYCPLSIGPKYVKKNPNSVVAVMPNAIKR